MTQPDSGQQSVYALLADGRTVEIRPTTAADFDAVKAMHEAMSPNNAYLRFFSLSRISAQQEAKRVTRAPGPDHAALLAIYDGQVVGLASYEVPRASAGQANPRTAEVAFAVADTMHHRGIATLLLEHLVSLARGSQLEALVAETLPENTGMLRVFSDAGLPVRSKREDGAVSITIPLPPDDSGTQLDSYLDRVAVRERSASVASLRPVFAPQSVAVIGASRQPGTVGRSVLENIAAGGFAGRLYAVNPNAVTSRGDNPPHPPHAPQGDSPPHPPSGSREGAPPYPPGEIAGIPCFPDVESLPEAPDLALLAVPPDAVTDVAEACGRRGVRGLVVFTAAVDAPAGAALLAVCRRYGMRLIGPNCFGIAVPSIGLDATFAAANPLPGTVGLVMQSGGLGFAMVDHLTRLGIGISSFASVGNKLDVSSNDMLMWWEQDGLTRLAVLYIESFGNPRKFGRTARRAGLKMPVLTVHAGRSEAGQRAAASHTAAAATPLVTREALFEQAGIIATPSFGELMGATALLSTQPPPAGRTVAIVSNVGGAGVLAADACTDLGLAVHHPREESRRRLREIVPAAGSVSGPVDTAATVSRAAFRAVLETLGADQDVHAVIALILRTGATGDLLQAVAEASLGVPLAVVVLNQPEAVRLVPAGGGQAPCYAYPEVAARALSRAVKYALWRTTPRQTVPAFTDVDQERGRSIVHAFLSGQPGGWLPQRDAAGLLAAYLIPLAADAGGDQGVLTAADPATAGPATAGSTTAGSTTAGSTTAGSAIAAAAQAGHPVLRVGVQDDQMFGPLVVLGPGGDATGWPAGQAARLAPLTEADADALIGSVRSAALPHGYRSGQAADLAGLRDLLLRVSRLSDDLPEITELDLSPVIVRPDGAIAAGVRIRVAPQAPQDPFLRRLR
jgi:acyl-CoA synthetase (NDP forming)/L-amino acid N-acyltransferase YncA